MACTVCVAGHLQMSPSHRCRYIIEAWDDLAHRFQLHLKKGTRVQVHGSLKVDRFTSKETGAPQTKTCINVSSAWIIDPTTIPPESGTVMSHLSISLSLQSVPEAACTHEHVLGSTLSAPQRSKRLAADCRLQEELWDELRASPDSFWDNRSSKVNPRAPDFVHKATGDALWASSDPPQWYVEENAYATATGPQLDPVVAGDAMDQTYTAPPDYGDASADGLAEIAAAGATPGSWGGASGGAAAAATDRWGGAGGSYFGAAAGGGVAAGAAGGRRAAASGDMAALWEEYRNSPGSFWDNREGKRNPRAPDFKHKQTGKGLWMESAPAWFDPSQVPARGSAGGGVILPGFPGLPCRNIPCRAVCAAHREGPCGSCRAACVDSWPCR